MITWERDDADRGRHFTLTSAGTYDVTYVPGGDPGHKFVGRLNGKALPGVSGSDVASVKIMVEQRLIGRRATVHYILPFRSLFLIVAKPEDIEAERQALEAQYGMKLAAYEVEIVTRSDTLCTSVSWEVARD